jgi:hypothetical protein
MIYFQSTKIIYRKKVVPLYAMEALVEERRYSSLLILDLDTRWG